MVRNQVVRLTPEGRDRLKEELEHLRHTKMPELTVRIQDANEHGDISDNSEYEDLKEEVRELYSTRLRESLLAQLRPAAKIVVTGTK